MFKRASTLILLLTVIALLCGCSTPLTTIANGKSASSSIKDTVTIVVTSDFGKELILERDIEIKAGTSAMDALQLVASVETKYGGGFVSSINGVSSEYGGANGKKEDWFFYINGVSSNVGAGDYILQTGDLEHWDFHNWSYHEFIPAIIGDYPQPFQSGYGDKMTQTVVVYEEPFATEAESLVERLKDDGVSQVSAVRDDRLSEAVKEQSNLIIIAGPENGLISELNKVYNKLGFYAYLESGDIMELDATGSLSGEYGAGSGIIQATQNPWNPKGISAGENVVWMVTGADADGVISAATVLTNHQAQLCYAFAAIVNEGQVVTIP